MTTPSPYPPGWYDDSTRPGWQRWWDGQQWTTHMRHPLPPGQASQPPPPNPALQHGRPAAAPGGAGPRWCRRQVLVPAALGFAVLVGIAAAVTPPPDTQVVAGSDATPATEATASSTTVTTTAAPATAASEPPTAGAPTTEPPATEPLATEAPTTEAPTTTVALTTTRPPTTKPPTTKPPTTAAPATTAAIKPLVGGGCDPNYADACVPIASDVDCAGGEGDGPAYVQGPVRVVGSDPHRLDADNDGIGCE